MRSQKIHTAIMMLAIQLTACTTAFSFRTWRLVGDLLDVVEQPSLLIQGISGQQADEAGPGEVGVETRPGLLVLERHRARLGALALQLGLGDGGDCAAGVGVLGVEAGAHPGTTLLPECAHERQSTMGAIRRQGSAAIPNRSARNPLLCPIQVNWSQLATTCAKR